MGIYFQREGLLHNIKILPVIYDNSMYKRFILVVYTLIEHTLVLQDNDYVSAIKSVASILADYDSDQMFPAFGFGAKSPQFGGVSHCFPLNFNFNQPEVRGVQVIYI